MEKEDSPSKQTLWIGSCEILSDISVFSVPKVVRHTEQESFVTRELWKKINYDSNKLIDWWLQWLMLQFLLLLIELFNEIKLTLSR